MAKSPSGHERKMAGEVKASDDGPVIVVPKGVDGTERRVVLNQLSGIDSQELMRATGLRVFDLYLAAEGSGFLNPDVAAAAVWLARRQSGENVRYEEVASKITFGALVDAVNEASEKAKDEKKDEKDGDEPDEDSDVIAVEEPGDPKG